MAKREPETYSESAKGVQISRARALLELRRHSCTDLALFFSECGDRESYSASAVLAWLGY